MAHGVMRSLEPFAMPRVRHVDIPLPVVVVGRLVVVLMIREVAVTVATEAVGSQVCGSVRLVSSPAAVVRNVRR